MATSCGSAWSSFRSERRISKRYPLLNSAMLHRWHRKQLGVVRDVSEDGLFVYTHFIPLLGDQLQIIINTSPHAMRVTGTVVRVEKEGVFGTVGIAIRIHSSDPRFIEAALMSLPA